MGRDEDDPDFYYVTEEDALSALESRNFPVLSEFLDDAALVVAEVADRLSSKQGDLLRFQKAQSPGRPSAAKDLRRLGARVFFAKLKYKKLEAAIVHVMKQEGKSRATVMRAWSAFHKGWK